MHGSECCKVALARSASLAHTLYATSQRLHNASRRVAGAGARIPRVFRAGDRADVSAGAASACGDAARSGRPCPHTGILWWNAHVLPFTERWWNGFAFYPASGFLAFSDPRLGESLIATPLQWLGASPVTAYNVTFLATYPLSALAAHWLGFVLTRRHDAAAVAGLTYGFCPFVWRTFRISNCWRHSACRRHSPPCISTRTPGTGAGWWSSRSRWSCRAWCSSYYLVFFAVLLALWAMWFIRPGNASALTGIVIAGLCALAALAPLAIGYGRAHVRNALERSLNEIVAFSADATSILTAHPTVRLWAWTAPWGKSEGNSSPAPLFCCWYWPERSSRGDAMWCAIDWTVFRSACCQLPLCVLLSRSSDGPTLRGASRCRA